MQKKLIIIIIIMKIKKIKKKIKKQKEKIIIKSIKEFQTPNEELIGETLFNFMKEFEYDNFIISNGMCFGEWGWFNRTK